jgi:DNA-binding CsgD family transcriptional regulator
MHLTYRHTRLADLDQCISLTRNGFAFKAHERVTLIDMWRYLLSNGMAISAVVIDLDRPLAKQVVGFGMSTFPTDEFVEEARTTLSPYYARHIFDRWVTGASNLPLFDACQIRHRNSSNGLNIAVIHRGWGTAGTHLDPNEFQIGPKLYESFVALNSGYNLNCLHVEVYGELDKQRLSGFGLKCLTDYKRSFEAGFPPPPAGCHPYLMEATAAEILARPYHATTALFLRRPPRIYFSSQEQALLQQAILGERDGEIALSLGIAVSTVHKRWRNIFTRVIDADPLVIPICATEGRGPEKRSILLRFLTDHPEELRPAVRPDGS